MSEWLMKSKRFLNRNSATILTVAGAVGVVATAALAVKETPKALDILKKEKKEKGGELTKLEVVKAALPVYIPTIVMAVTTIGCIVGANTINKRHQAALASAYALLSTSYADYRSAAKEIYGEDADIRIQREVVKSKYNDTDASWGGEKELFFDHVSGRYFESTMADVIDAEYKFNRNFALRGYANLNEFYEFLGIPSIDAGEVLGWSFEAGQVFYGYSWVDFAHEKAVMDDGLECWIITTPFSPTVDYNGYYGDE